MVGTDRYRSAQYRVLAGTVGPILGPGRLRVQGQGGIYADRANRPLQVSDTSRQMDTVALTEVTQLVTQVVQWALENADYLEQDLWYDPVVTDAVMTLLVLVRDGAMKLRTWNRHTLEELVIPMLNPSNTKFFPSPVAPDGHANRVRLLQEWEADRPAQEAKEADAARRREDAGREDEYQWEQRRLGRDALLWADALREEGEVSPAPSERDPVDYESDFDFDQPAARPPAASVHS